MIDMVGAILLRSYSIFSKNELPRVLHTVNATRVTLSAGKFEFEILY